MHTLFVLAAFDTDAVAQPFEQLLTYRYYSHLPAEYLDPEAAGADKFSFSVHQADITVPLSISTGDRRSTIIVGADFRHYEFRSLAGGHTNESTKFNRMGFRAGIVYRWPNLKHKTLLVGLPTFSTNGNLFSADAFQMGGLVIHSIQLRENFTLKFGMYYNREFFGNFFMGLAGVDWRLPNDWYIFGVLPGTFNIYKQVNPWLGMSISERAPNGSLLAAESEGDYVRFGRGVYTLYMFNLHLTPFKFSTGTVPSDITFTLSAGHTLDRKFELYLFPRNLIQDGPFFPARNGFLVQCSVSMRVWQ